LFLWTTDDSNRVLQGILCLKRCQDIDHELGCVFLYLNLRLSSLKQRSTDADESAMLLLIICWLWLPESEGSVDFFLCVLILGIKNRTSIERVHETLIPDSERIWGAMRRTSSRSFIILRLLFFFEDKNAMRSRVHVWKRRGSWMMKPKQKIPFSPRFTVFCATDITAKEGLCKFSSSFILILPILSPKTLGFGLTV
jgi:hypothetical protein